MSTKPTAFEPTIVEREVSSLDEALEEVPVTNLTGKPKRVIRQYTDEDRYIALAAVDLNGGNVYRTAIALDIPAKTLDDWVRARLKRMANRAEEFAKGRNEKRGDLAAKLEDVAHTIVEAMPGKVAKATLSQSAVAVGIAIDKVRVLRSQVPEPDPEVELCRLLGIHRSQLPETLELGDLLPEGFGEIIDVTPQLEAAKSPANPSQDAGVNTTEAPAKLPELVKDESAN